MLPPRAAPSCRLLLYSPPLGAKLLLAGASLPPPSEPPGAEAPELLPSRLLGETRAVELVGCRAPRVGALGLLRLFPCGFEITPLRLATGLRGSTAGRRRACEGLWSVLGPRRTMERLSIAVGLLLGEVLFDDPPLLGRTVRLGVSNPRPPLRLGLSCEPGNACRVPPARLEPICDLRVGVVRPLTPGLFVEPGRSDFPPLRRAGEGRRPEPIRGVREGRLEPIRRLREGRLERPPTRPDRREPPREIEDLGEVRWLPDRGLVRGAERRLPPPRWARRWARASLPLTSTHASARTKAYRNGWCRPIHITCPP